MKTKAWVVFTLVLLFAVAANATDLPKMNVVKVEDNTALVAYKSDYNVPLQVTLSNSNGEILYHKQTERCKEFKQMLNLSELGEGEFCVCINYGNESISRKITVKDNNISVEDATRCFEPYFCMKNEHLNVSFLNTSKKPVFLNVYKDGEHVYGYNLGRGLDIQKGFDLSHLEHGTYEVVLTDKVKDHKYIAKL
ncbi:hypothetical protein SLH46_03275 [Draconibacterium sp. IB214405]|uniref:hypothetical protein n=1 Tax=Draconibacterium sp. IB214405 TaxID=3097352 RepID=UPI002A10C096|nr:hypothetical protein [Draconibacterium sp. IB214405]MDX8338190.1 hypothetical protein [Draconibacterium sp. IB214405]